MRKTVLVTILTGLALLLTACASSASASSASGSSSNNGFGNLTSRAPSRTTILAVGIFKLEGTPHAIDKTTAGKLLPLWQLMNQLNTSSSTAPQEVTAVEDAIQTTMTPEQYQAIQAMGITQRDVFAVLQQTGALTFGPGQNGGTRTGNPNRGGNGGGGLGFLFGGGPNGAIRTGGGTPTASGTGSATSGAATALITQLIKLLQSKIQAG